MKHFRITKNIGIIIMLIQSNKTKNIIAAQFPLFIESVHKGNSIIGEPMAANPVNNKYMTILNGE